ncbi:hypothetical protein BDV32DRAFT_158863 [Aspergillus pseudonomiae]|uniref:methylated diphthine methylhydrolase n=1 Tax=Aspergillus pseudonomiae TaxID=1506151 RepID=A0A5N7DLA1_9EURO|nr:uncharacterized protein BDV37DRAFT_280142 [Aspergillus pseudonomiae]KAB8260231.1 hypothetical protein BDV32DRAFT_158863 [Aspergillus pseudonomiae]KAE8407231.1 hypothetical protein BDV37DRAFT_280142 [Aspergillus pseudonomiae]
MPQTPQSATTVYLDQPPSCLQTCPASPNHIVIGTYLLTETKDEAKDTIQQTKTGSLQLWQLTAETNTLTRIQTLPLPHAVFDLHFHPTDPTLFAIATSSASVSLFRVSLPSGGEPEIRPLWTKAVHEDPSIPALFLAWTPASWLTAERADGVAVTFSDGRTSVFGAPEGISDGADAESGLVEVGCFAARESIEVWFVAVAVLSDGEGREPVMFTGDDFGGLHTRRFLCEKEGEKGEGEEGELLAPVVSDYNDRARHHTAGVTAILPLSVAVEGGAPVVLTGSYDESLRVYHATRRGEVLAEVGLGGGVWRLQLLRTDHGVLAAGEEWKFLVLASCMHAGTRVVKVTHTVGEATGWEIEVLAEFTEHQSMNYASDVWKPDGGYDLQGKDMSELLCISSSFYDRRLCLWRVNV